MPLGSPFLDHFVDELFHGEHAVLGRFRKEHLLGAHVAGEHEVIHAAYAGLDVLYTDRDARAEDRGYDILAAHMELAGEDDHHGSSESLAVSFIHAAPFDRSCV